MRLRVYVETTILSYLAARPTSQPVAAARQLITRQWWEREKDKYVLLISEVVETECDQGDPIASARRREYLKDYPFFRFTASYWNWLDDWSYLVLSPNKQRRMPFTSPRPQSPNVSSC